MKRPIVLSYYLPQFHPFKENDEWWGKGFTEWTNVAKAKPLFPFHHQPNIPKDLGFYDLRLPEVREQQAELAKEAGVTAFCYWHYWFNGHKLMELPFEEVVDSGKPNFPFCLSWANHSWYAKEWNKDGKDRLLMEQTYGGEEDYRAHFNYLLKAFKDERYLKIDGKLVFGIYASKDFKDFSHFKVLWNQLAIDNGLKGFHFFTHTFKIAEVNELKDFGYDTILLDYLFFRQNIVRYIYLFGNKLGLLPQIIDFKDYARTLIDNYPDMEGVAPMIEPNWDHTPRSGKRGSVIINSTPEFFYNLVDNLFNKIKTYKNQPSFYMIKSWNEWGEGNYMEPDLRYEKGYISSLRRAIDNNF